MRNTLAHIANQYLFPAAIDEQLPRVLRRLCEYTGYAIDWLIFGSRNWIDELDEYENKNTIGTVDMVGAC